MITTIRIRSSSSSHAPRAARERAAILDGAAPVFLANGYVGTSMDEIAAVAAASK
ncbi:MAG: hypothetical protein ACRD0G_00995 [Acidimicrobiales bacterium]